MPNLSIASARHAFEKDELLREKARPFEAGWFFKRASSFKRVCLLTGDATIFMACVFIGYYLSAGLKHYYFPELSQITPEKAISSFPLLFGLPMILLLILSEMQGHYSRFKGFWEEYGEFIRSVAIVVGVTTAYLFLARQHFSRFWFVSTWLVILVSVPAGRVLVKHWMMHSGVWFSPTVVIGSGRNALESALAMESNILMGFKVVALIDVNKHDGDCIEESEPIEDFLSGRKKTFPVYPFTTDFLGNLEVNGAPYLVLAVETEDYDKHRNVLERMAATRFNMSIIPPLRGLPLFGTEISPIFRHEVLHMRIRNNLARTGFRAVKRVFDAVISALLLLVLAPVFLYLGYQIKKDGGPIFYSQQRIGRQGKPFRCYKFRSMVVDADSVLDEILSGNLEFRDQWVREQKLKDDPRITQIGRRLRKYSLDELPQLWNVLKGDMSLVGPRPVLADELARYGNSASYYLQIPPGITGLWQVSGRNNLSYETRVNLDSWYVRNWSLWYDITILFKTIKVVFTRDGAY